MFKGKGDNTDLNHNNEKALRILRNSFSSFEELLRKSNKCPINIICLEQLMYEATNTSAKKSDLPCGTCSKTECST